MQAEELSTHPALSACDLTRAAIIKQVDQAHELPREKGPRTPANKKQAPHRFGAASHTQLLVPALQRKAAQRMAPTWMT